MIPDLNARGYLPAGRYNCTLDEIEQKFVDSFPTDTTRKSIWGDFKKYISLLRKTNCVCALWIGGSFTSKKTNPSDIDVVAIINSDQVPKSGPVFKMLSFCTAGHDFKAHSGLAIDSFGLWWKPDTSGGYSQEPDYFQYRGYWDDFWQRTRSGLVRHSVITRNETFPKRGYLEVTINDYK
ncbi:MAG: hypothetical protein ABF545_05115 [Bifidobacterium psychraerophilum]|uniref:DUF6932 family protein n=1 Tax=Bifidobacterium psychraerophilum TaxID=218140 RepID=UPI0039EBE0A8